ncbi:hypothetical protein EMEDMD4_570012 [Sinorhizobium medicae]|uniref:Uncharacterized protein n=1 Tax=Sinorhizobium medicae TaxID=110321 RepID=A0A508X2R1_9HYPH|nr:hypothetical protein EMEDMD4_570012 [Sinorhizobium medicae]
MSWRNDIFHLQPDEDYSIAQRRATLSSMNVAVALGRVSILIDFQQHALDFLAIIVFDGPILTSQFMPSNSAADVHFHFQLCWCDHAYRLCRRRRKLQNRLGGTHKGGAPSGACDNASARSGGTSF